MSIVIVLTAASVAAYVGVFGDRVAIELQNGFRLLFEGYEQYADLIDKAVRYVGVAITAVIGVLTLYKTWHYAEMNLPRRLAQFVARQIVRHDAARAQFLESVGTDQFDLVVAPQPPRQWFHALKWLNPLHRHEPALQFTTGSASIDASIDALQKSISHFQYRKASAHIAKGILLARRASAQTFDDDGARLALESFRAAIDARNNDLDALELAAKQTRRLHGSPKEIEDYLKRLESEAIIQGEAARAARALRFQTELVLDQGTQGSLESARQLLTRAIDLIKDNMGLDARVRTKELARLYEARGAIQIRREKFFAAGQDLNDAIKCYRKLDDEGKSGLDRVDELQATLDRLKNDKESSGD